MWLHFSQTNDDIFSIEPSIGTLVFFHILIAFCASSNANFCGVQTTIAISYPNLDGGSVYNIISAIGNVDGGFPESFYSLEAAYDGGIV